MPSNIVIQINRQLVEKLTTVQYTQNSIPYERTTCTYSLVNSNIHVAPNLIYKLLPLQKCCIHFAHIVGNILHAICMYATYYLMSICICANYKKLTKNWAYARNMRSTKYIFFAYMQNMCRIQRMQNVCILHTCIVHVCIVHIIIMRFAHMLYICQLHASFIYALCFNDIIINYVMHNNAQDLHSNIVSTLQIFLSFILFFSGT